MVTSTTQLTTTARGLLQLGYLLVSHLQRARVSLRIEAGCIEYLVKRVFRKGRTNNHAACYTKQRTTVGATTVFQPKRTKKYKTFWTSSSKACWIPSLVFAEHSMKTIAFDLAYSAPSDFVTSRSDCFEKQTRNQKNKVRCIASTKLKQTKENEYTNSVDFVSHK